MSIEEITARYEALNAEHQAVVAKLTADNLHLKNRIGKLEAMIFGRSSERRAEELGSAQPSLFEVARSPMPNPPMKKEEVAGYTRSKRLEWDVLEPEHEEGTLPAHLMRVEAPPIDDIPEGADKADCEFVGTKVTERLAEEPSHVYVIRTVRRVYKRKGTGEFLPAPAPRHIFGRCQVDESFLIGMVVKKILWHLPLYRQHQALKLQGVDLPRSNFPYWMTKLATLFAPMPKAIEAEVRSSDVVHCDETPMLVAQRGEDGKKHYGDAYLWPLLAAGIGVVFIYRPGRTAMDAKAVLAGINGQLVSDAYNEYEKLTRSSGQGWQLCMMHIRRNFIDAEASNPAKAKEALDFIRELYRIEKAAKHCRPTERLKLRIAESKPVMEQFGEWLKTTAATPEAITDDLLSKAISYVWKRWDAACLFLKDGRVPIDNGAAERAIRPVKLGAKNWLFASSELGAQTLAIFYSLIGSAMMHEIHPYYYLLDLCKRVDQRGLTAKDLVPHRWKERFYEEAVPEWLRKRSPGRPPPEDTGVAAPTSAPDG